MAEPRVLVADDDNDLQDLMVRRLNRLGLAADRANDGATALGLIEHSAYDLIVTDMYMPGATGLQILRAAKDRDPHVQVLVVTGSATLENAIEALNDGAFAYMMKPLDHLSVFDTTVSRALEFRHLVLDNLRMAEIQRRRGDMLEEEVTERVQQIRRRHQELVDVLACLPDGVMEVEEGGRVALSSPAAEKWLAHEQRSANQPIQAFLERLKQNWEETGEQVTLGDQTLSLTAVDLPARDGRNRKVVILREMASAEPVKSEPQPIEAPPPEPPPDGIAWLIEQAKTQPSQPVRKEEAAVKQLKEAVVPPREAGEPVRGNGGRSKATPQQPPAPSYPDASPPHESEEQAAPEKPPLWRRYRERGGAPVRTEAEGANPHPAPQPARMALGDGDEHLLAPGSEIEEEPPPTPGRKVAREETRRASRAPGPVATEEPEEREVAKPTPPAAAPRRKAAWPPPLPSQLGGNDEEGQ
jgi:CheY-like chemotaxis protein